MPTIATPEPVGLVVGLVVGTVTVSAGERDRTTVTVTPADPGSAEDVRAAERTRVEGIGARVEVRGPRGLRRFSPFSAGGSVDVHVEVPSGSALEVSGDIVTVRTEGPLGDVRCTLSAGDVDVDRATAAVVTTSGRVALDDVGGDATVSSTDRVDLGVVGGSARVDNANGAIRVGRARGALRCRTANGDIDVDVVEADADLRTANGDVVVGDLARGEASIETGRGRVRIGVRRGTAARLDVRSRWGRIENRLARTEGPAETEDLATLRVRTTYGDVVIGRPDRVAVPPTP